MATSSPQEQRVAVIGLGAMGIVTVKNLLEEGFNVTGFDRNGYVGGLWHFTEDEDTLSVLECKFTTQFQAVVEVLKDSSNYCKRLYRSGTPPFCSAKQVNEYLENYVDHFNLRPHLRLNTAAKYVAREEESDRWRLDFELAPSEHFDKVVIATGPHLNPVMPEINGSSLFAGMILHSKSFKRPEAFTGKKVVVLGLGNTGSDIADILVGHASSIYISHNHGAIVLPRDIDKVTGSKGFTHRFSIIVGFLERWCPSLSEALFNRKAKSIMSKAFGDVDPAWRLDPAPSVKVTNPVVSDTLINRLRAGDIQTIPGIKKVTGPKELELTDGQVVEADAIICCTGYKYGFDILDPQVDPSDKPAIAWLKAWGSKGRPLPRLYQNVFSLKQPDSLAFLGCAWFITSAFCLADLTSMCIAQVWAGHSKLPPQPEMHRWMDQQEQRITGMGVEEHLGWGWKGWLFWWRERPLWKMLMDGPQTAAAWRLFDGKRKKWDGARAEIERANEVGEFDKEK
ncbi:hypothetical protein NW757_000981 [Fusarium falciforme]|nr:hypothetical protein NW757_000981 [Fusarium falciforme]